jgi:carbon storage regulator
MLVLTRHKNEQIMIGDEIVITLLDIRGDKVRLGITAPVEKPVHRHEVWQALRDQRRETPGGGPGGGPLPA